MKTLFMIGLLVTALAGCGQAGAVRSDAPTGTHAASHLCVASCAKRGEERLLFSGSLIPAEKQCPYLLFVQCDDIAKTGESNPLLIGIDKVHVLPIGEIGDFAWLDDMLALDRENDGTNREFSPTISIGLFTASGPGDPTRIDKSALPFQQCLLLCDTLTGCYLAWSRESGWIGRRAMRSSEKHHLETLLQRQ